jgi:hypothetical protein
MSGSDREDEDFVWMERRSSPGSYGLHAPDLTASVYVPSSGKTRRPTFVLSLSRGLANKAGLSVGDRVRLGLNRTRGAIKLTSGLSGVVLSQNHGKASSNARLRVVVTLDGDVQAYLQNRARSTVVTDVQTGPGMITFSLDACKAWAVEAPVGVAAR